MLKIIASYCNYYNTIILFPKLICCHLFTSLILISTSSPLPKAMEIKLKLDTEKTSKVVVAITAAYGLCQVSGDAEYPQLATANTTALIVIIAILYGPRLGLKITKSA